MKRHKIIFYKTPIDNAQIDIIYREDTFWLSQKKLAELFGTQVPAINKHIKNILADEELDISTISKMEIVQQERTREVTRVVEHYNLDMIIAIKGLIERHEAMDMAGLQKSIDKFLDFNEYRVLENFGSISHQQAKQKAYNEYDKFKLIENKTYESDFDKSVKALLGKGKS